MPRHRPAPLLASLLLIATSGCAGLNPPGVDERGRVDLGRGDVHAFKLPMPVSFQLSYSFQVDQGRPIDVVVLAEDEYPAFKKGTNWTYVGPCSTMGEPRGQRECDLDRGTYFLVIDNSGRGKADPSTNATAPISVAYDIRAV